MKTNKLSGHLAAAVAHLQAALVVADVRDADVPVPDAVDAAVFADPTFKVTQGRFHQSIAQLVADCPPGDYQRVVLAAEEAAHAAIATAIDAAWRIGRSARPGATS